jgi:hypothetical protein
VQRRGGSVSGDNEGGATFTVLLPHPTAPADAALR